MSKADELIRLLHMSASYFDPNEDRNHISGLEHSIRVASLAKRHGARTEMVFAGLVHDVARPLSDIYHGEVIAEIVRDVVSDNAYMALRTHGDFQSAYIHGSVVPHQHQPWYGDAISLCAWEVGSFTKHWMTSKIDLLEAVGLIRNVCGER